MTQSAVAQGPLLGRRLNLPFLLALAVVVGAYVVAFYVLRFLVPQQEIAGTIAALSLGGGAYVQKAIETRLRQPPAPVTPMAGFLRPWLLILGVGVLAVWLAQALVPWIQLRGGPMTAVSSNINSVLSLLPPAAAAGVGVLAGQRSDRFPFLVTLLAVGGGWLLSSLTYQLVVGAAVGQPMPPDGSPPGGLPPNPVDFYFGSAGALAFLLSDWLPLLTVAAMAGLWYGSRTRLQAYVGGLLREIKPADRTALVELAYEDARAAQAGRASAQERISEAAAREPGD